MIFALFFLLGFNSTFILIGQVGIIEEAYISFQFFFTLFSHAKTLSICNSGTTLALACSGSGAHLSIPIAGEKT